MKKIAFIFILVALVSCMQYSESKNSSAKSDSASSLKKDFPSEDEFYSIFSLNNLIPELKNIRPLQMDTLIQFCIPAAFTILENDSIDGLFIVDGKIISSKINHHLGGGMLIDKNNISIIKTDAGKLITNKWIDSILNLNQSFFQQIQLVRNDSALEFHIDQKLFQRRAVVIWNTGEYAVVESKSAITLQEFADDLAKMKVKDAIYTDMGSFDEGWYRNPNTGKVVSIGKNKMETSRQSNWLVFKR